MIPALKTKSPFTLHVKKQISINSTKTMKMNGNVAALAVAICCVTSGQTQDMRGAYERAALHLPAEAVKRMRNVSPDPVWLEGEDKFTYCRQLAGEEKEYLLVDAAANTVAPAFDHARLAASLSAATKKTYEARKLPFNRVALVRGGAEFAADGKEWRCSLANYACSIVAAKDPEELVSPDGRWVAFTRANNLWLRSVADRREFALTEDGIADYAYAAYAEGINSVTDRRSGRKLPPLAQWSPDSKRLLTVRTDERKVGSMYLVQAVPDQLWSDGGPRRPLLHSYKYALPGDENVPRLELMVFEVATRRRTNLRIPALVQHAPDHQGMAAALFNSKRAFWSEDSATAFAVELSRDQKALRLWSADVTTGFAKVLAEERAATYVEYGIAAELMPKRGQFVWWSERSGWGHLYLYGLDGKLVRPLTAGEWVVRAVLRVDQERGQVFFSASGRESGRDPWLQSVYRIDVETGVVTAVAVESADHAVLPEATDAQNMATRFSPTGNFFIDNYSRVDEAPVTVLRDRGGKVIREIEKADVSAYEALKAPRPKTFVVKARDGKTDLYGTLHFPSTFDASRKYSVVESNYPGPQAVKAPKRFQAGSVEQAVAELGFIVFQVDGLGQPWRSKAYHDYAYGNMGDTGGIEDHVEALRQLGQQYGYLDLNRVGIFGHSGGGFASTRAILLYPDFYKVAVSSAGNHDQLGYFFAWGEKYQGLVDGQNFDNQDTTKLAKNLKGKLLLAYGDMDDNVHNSMTVRLMDALIRANRDFDVLVMPNGNHAFSSDPYFNRRRWDYLVRHLLGEEPPAGFELKAVNPPPQ